MKQRNDWIGGMFGTTILILEFENKRPWLVRFTLLVSWWLLRYGKNLSLAGGLWFWGLFFFNFFFISNNLVNMMEWDYLFLGGGNLDPMLRKTVTIIYVSFIVLLLFWGKRSDSGSLYCEPDIKHSNGEILIWKGLVFHVEALKYMGHLNVGRWLKNPITNMISSKSWNA